MAMLGSAFADPVFSAQSTFRAVLDAVARPGEIKRFAMTIEGPAPLTPAMAALALTLFDQDTPVWRREMPMPFGWADLIRVHMAGDVPAVRSVWRIGRRVA